MGMRTVGIGNADESARRRRPREGRLRSARRGSKGGEAIRAAVLTLFLLGARHQVGTPVYDEASGEWGLLSSGRASVQRAWINGAKILDL